MRPWIAVLLAGCGRVGFDAGAADAASETDAPADAGPPCPDLPGLLFCESFEGTDLLATTAGTVTMSDVRAVRGTHSQHAQTVGMDEPSWQLGGVLPYVTTGHLYARWYIYLPSTVTSVELASVHLVEQSLPFHGVIFGAHDGSADLTSTVADVTMMSSIALPRDRWVCAQMHVAISDADGAIDAAVDGQPFGALANIDTLPDGGYRNVHAGLFATSYATGPIEMWTDEVAVGTQPIPCE